MPLQKDNIRHGLIPVFPIERVMWKTIIVVIKPYTNALHEMPSSVMSAILQEYDITLTVTSSMMSTYPKSKQKEYQYAPSQYIQIIRSVKKEINFLKLLLGV